MDIQDLKCCGNCNNYCNTHLECNDFFQKSISKGSTLKKQPFEICENSWEFDCLTNELRVGE